MALWTYRIHTCTVYLEAFTLYMGQTPVVTPTTEPRHTITSPGCSLGVLLQSVGGNPMTLLRPVAGPAGLCFPSAASKLSQALPAQAAAVYLLDGTCQLSNRSRSK